MSPSHGPRASPGKEGPPKPAMLVKPSRRQARDASARRPALGGAKPKIEGQCQRTKEAVALGGVERG